MPDTIFSPLVVGALYPSIERGLTADVLAARALGGQAYPICTSHVIAGNGRVTDVLEVPSDAVSGQLEHVFSSCRPTGARVGVVGSAASAEVIIRLLGQLLTGPLVLDLTLSGPSGEDLADGRVRDVLQKALPLPDLVTIRRVDAELVAGMRIGSLDDAQVAVQRLHRLGARSVLLRTGLLAADAEADPQAFHTDLLYDGSDFMLFEAPVVAEPGAVHGASSALTLSLLHALWRGRALDEAVREAKRFVTDALRLRATTALPGVPAYYAAAQASLSTS